MLRSFRTAPGFTLVEAVVAIAIVSIAMMGFAQLLSRGARQADTNRRALTAIVAAQSKLEELTAAPWTKAEADSLRISPPGSLFEDVSGYRETLDAGGAIAFVRRWAISPMEPSEPGTLILQVCVFGYGAGHPAPEACVSTIRTRRP